MPKKQWCHCNGPTFRFANFCSWCGFPIPPNKWIKDQAFCFFYHPREMVDENSFFVLPITQPRQLFDKYDEALSAFARWMEENIHTYPLDWEIILGEFCFPGIHYLKKTITLRRWWSTAQGKIDGQQYIGPMKIKVFDLQENL